MYSIVTQIILVLSPLHSPKEETVTAAVVKPKYPLTRQTCIHPPGSSLPPPAPLPSMEVGGWG